MKDRIQILLDKLGITRAQLAQKLGVNRSRISHIISGRNQPNIDFVTKLLELFPELNAKWLLTGEGEIGNYENKNNKEAKEKDSAIQSRMFEDLPENKAVLNNNLNLSEENNTIKYENHEVYKNQYSQEEEQNTEIQKEMKDVSLKCSNKGLEVDRVIIFYKSGEIKEYSS